MGSFGGHAIPGTFFFVVGVWHTIQAIRRYLRCQRKKEVFVSSTWYPMDCCCKQLKDVPFEPFIKIMLSLSGVTIEITQADYKDGVFNDPMNEQHTTMYMFFCMNAILEVLTHYKLAFSPLVNHLSFALAYFIEFILFNYHLHGRSGVDVLIHTFLLYAICAAILSIVYMLVFRNHLLATLVHAFTLLLQGSWFWQIGFLLYSPLPGATKWDDSNHDNMMLATCYFAWHIGGVFVFMWFIVAIVSLHSNRCGRVTNRDLHDFDLERLIPRETSTNPAGYDGTMDESDDCLH